MAGSVFFTESKDFKLIRDKILSLDEQYVIYLYADTTNVKIPKELIKDLPFYGNNLVWVDTATMDASQMANHIVLMIGQLLDSEEEIGFYIVSKTAKFEKTIQLLRGIGIPVEWIGPEGVEKNQTKARRGRPAKTGGTGKRGRPRKVEANADDQPKRRGRPPKATPATTADASSDAPKKRGRPAKKDKVEKTAPKVRKTRQKKEKTARTKTVQTRTRKPITEEEINTKIAAFSDLDYNAEMVLRLLFGQPKVARPKLTVKLVDLIKSQTLEDDMGAEALLKKISDLGLITVSAETGRILYQD